MRENRTHGSMRGSRGTALGEMVRLIEALDSERARNGLANAPSLLGVQRSCFLLYTMLNAGTKVNVIPSVAEAKCDARLLPGQTADDLLRELRAVIGSDVEIEFLDRTAALESDYRTPLFDTIGRVMARHAPHAPVLPYLVVGATDARHVRKLGTKVYGFAPMFAPTSELDRVHAHDERISIDNLAFGTQVLYEVVSEFCGKP